ncbi:unnamed protein product [Brassica rapa]|uniref:Uncharacterized protein n=2 Tax=Brassica TaxID=3705 RepID=A0A8D9HKT0_BRACM|nr:unnamed protein product [Brassica napus]CAG7901274.1 unnamed protein product [Brassica rapa]
MSMKLKEMVILIYICKRKENNMMRLFFVSELLLLSPVSMCCLDVSTISVLRYCCRMNQLPN